MSPDLPHPLRGLWTVSHGTLVLALSLAVLTAAGAAVPEPAPGLEISRRVPAPDEVGYRPADGSTSAVNPPSFAWLHESAAATYSLELSTHDTFQDAPRAGGFRWNAYTPSAPVAPGLYYWRYRFATRDGRESGWSPTRRVLVPEGARILPQPTPAEQRARVPAGHPRLFLRPEDLPRLRQAAGIEPGNGGLAAPELERARVAFAELRRVAERLLETGPTPEPEHLGSARDKDNAERVKYWWPNREQTLKACQEAETLAFLARVTGEPQYAEAARRWILHLAAWDPDGPTNFELNCEAAKPLLHRLARAYDWAYDALTEADREQVRKVVQRRIADAWKSGEVGQGTGHLNRPYGSHANRTWHKIGESGIAFLGEIPEAEMWLDYALTKFHAVYPVWSDDDGGWHEGVSYWAGYLGKVVWWLQAADSALALDGLQKPFFAQVGDFPLYVAPPGSPNMGFGDLSHGRPAAGWGGFLEYFVRAKGAQPDGARAGNWRWWMERWGMKGQEGILGFLYAANLPALPPAVPPTGLPPSKVFRGIGVASLHTTLVDSADDVHFLFKSSPFGTQSHGHNAHNTFQLNAHGEALLTTCVYRDLHGSKFHYQWAHSTLAQNGVLVDGRGQIPHTAAPHGRIADHRFGPDADYLVGDATEAYGDALRRYRRHVVFVKGPRPFLVLWDDLAAARPARFQFLLHALSPFTLETNQARLSLQRPKAGLRVDYQAGQPLAFRQWDGYQPPPTKSFPNQWHVEASTLDPAVEAAVFTVIAPGRGTTPVALTSQRRESPTAFGVRVTLDGQEKTVAFVRPGVTGEARLDDRPVVPPYAIW